MKFPSLILTTSIVSASLLGGMAVASNLIQAQNSGQSSTKFIVGPQGPTRAQSEAGPQGPAGPVSLILNHLNLAIHDGNPYLTYLVTYPIFIATDILLPLLLIALWLEYRYESHYIYTKVKRVRRF